MKENSITVLKVEPEKEPRVIQIDNTLESLQQQVGGLICVVYLEDGNLMVVNDEGKINGMKPNRWIADDIICGSFFICGDSDEGDFTSLSAEKVQEYKQKFQDIPDFTGQEYELEPRIEVITFGF